MIDVSNAAAATIQGMELEGETLLRGNVTAGGHLVWLNARYDRYLVVGAGGISSDVAGMRLNNSPEWSARAWSDWTWAIGDTRSVSFRADSRWKTTVFFSPLNDAIQRQRPVGLLDISAEFGPRERRWSVAAYLRNVTNEDYITGTVGTPPPAIGGRPGDPRQVGVQLAITR